MTFILRPYQPDQDGPAAFDLYQATLGQEWPLRYDFFRQLTTEHPFYRPGDHFTASSGGKLVGFSATQILRPGTQPDSWGGLQVIFVDPVHRRQGIGRALHNMALDRVRKLGLSSLKLGGGGMMRLWPGIPDNFSESQGFFVKMGWTDFNRCCDLIQDVREYQIPDSLRQRMSREGIDLHPTRADEIPLILEFEHEHFDGWYHEYAYKTALGEHTDILAAWQEGKGVVGTLLMFSPYSKLLSVNLVWKELLGDDVGGMGAVGTVESERGRGIGIALVAWGTEVLKERGVGNAMIDWTRLVDFYGKAGYQPWRWYTTGAHKL